jgi:ribosome maturation factor RimP
MNQESQVRIIEKRITDLLIDEPGYFIVEVSIKPANNIKVFVDADQGASIDRLTKLNRVLYKWVEESMYPDGDFSLEVSSPGLDEPIKLHRQYIKNIGRFVEVFEIEGERKEGKLLSATTNEIIIEETKGKGKKMEIIEHRIPIEQIKSTKIQIKF